MSAWNDPPPAGTQARHWWGEGARAEAACRTEGRDPAGREVAQYADALAEYRGGWDEPSYAGWIAHVFYAGVPLRRRLALAWALLWPGAHGPAGHRRT